MLSSLICFTKHGFRHVTCHGLRHTYCSLLLSQNVPIQTVSKYLWHSDPALTLKANACFLYSRYAGARSPCARLFNYIKIARKIFVFQAFLASSAGICTNTEEKKKQIGRLPRPAFPIARHKICRTCPLQHTLESCK